MNKKDLKNLFPEGVLSEDTFDAIETSFNERVQIHVEKALQEQDELYATKLEKLLESIDKDRARKLVKIVEQKDREDAKKLIKVQKRFANIVNKEAHQFKGKLVSTISRYLDTYLEEAIPQADIKEAVRNKQAISILESLRNTLAVDSALMNDQIREAVVDGKNTIDEANKKLATAERENKLLREAVNKAKVELLIEQKTASMDPKKKDYITKIFAGKSPRFIEENFDYTSKLFDKKAQERLSMIKEEAFGSRVSQHDFKPIVEKTEPKPKPQTSNPMVSSYLSALDGR